MNAPRGFSTRRETHDVRRPQAAERVTDVVLAAAHPGLEIGGKLDALMSRRAQADHALAKGQNIQLAFICGFQFQGH